MAVLGLEGLLETGGSLSVGLFAASIIIARSVQYMLQCPSENKFEDVSGKGAIAASLAGERVILAVDVGSSSVRCTAYRVDRATSNNILIHDCTSVWSEVNVVNGTADCERIFYLVNEVVCNSVTSLHKRDVSAIYAVGITTFAMTLVGVCQETFVSATPMFTYAGQGPEINAIAEQIKMEVSLSERNSHYARTGTVMHHPCYATAQLKKYAVHSKSSCEKLHWTTLSGYIIGKWSRLGINSPVSLSDAAWTGLLNMHTLEWDIKALQYLGLDDSHFAPIMQSSSMLSKRGLHIRENINSELFQETLICLGIGDGLAATIGSKCLCNHNIAKKLVETESTPCNISVTIGTSAAARFVTSFDSASMFFSADFGEMNRGLFGYRSSNRDILIGGSITDAGSLIAWYTKFVGHENISKFMDEISTLYLSGDISEIGGAPLTLPFWSGERSTGWENNSLGTVTGLNHNTSPQQLFISLLEGVMMRLRVITEQLKVAVGQHSVIKAIVGSGAVLEKHWVWRQMLADITNLPVMVMKEIQGETTLNGLAKHMSSTTESGVIGNNFEVSGEPPEVIFGFSSVDIEEVNYPVATNHLIFDERFRRINQLYRDYHEKFDL